MAETTSLLVLRLEGALQSWGENAKWDFRDSSTMPTKSGIVGLLGCALGENRGSDTLVELSKSITVAVRADRPGVKIVDFQTVQGFSQDGKPQLMAATGKPKTTGNTILSPHAYLQDACFTVFVETSDLWQKRIIAALNDPQWCLYLGRKNCVPSRPILECLTEAYCDLLDAVRRYPPAPRAEQNMVYECEIPDAAATSLLRTDELVGPEREFALRQVWRGVVKRGVKHVSD